MKLTQSEINVICADEIKHLAWNMENLENFSNNVIVKMHIHITRDGKTVTYGHRIDVMNNPN